MRLPKRSLNINLSMAEERRQKKIEAEESITIREAILTGLLIDVADVFNVKLETVQSGNQQELTVLVRSIFYYVARTKTAYGAWPMATTAGRKDHAGVLRHVEIVKAYFKHKDPQFLTLWDYYLTNSNLFTDKDFPYE
jgi:chromosomal replication initiation ATPase DnaA